MFGRNHYNIAMFSHQIDLLVCNYKPNFKYIFFYTTKVSLTNNNELYAKNGVGRHNYAYFVNSAIHTCNCYDSTIMMVSLLMASCINMYTGAYPCTVFSGCLHVSLLKTKCTITNGTPQLLL